MFGSVDLVSSLARGASFAARAGAGAGAWAEAGKASLAEPAVFTRKVSLALPLLMSAITDIASCSSTGEETVILSPSSST
jgi:hypothetical protein